MGRPGRRARRALAQTHPGPYRPCGSMRMAACLRARARNQSAASQRLCGLCRLRDCLAPWNLTHSPSCEVPPSSCRIRSQKNPRSRRLLTWIRSAVCDDVCGGTHLETRWGGAGRRRRGFFRQKLNSSGWKMRINRKEGGKEGGEEGFRLSTAQRLLAVHFHPCMQFIVLNYSLCSGDASRFLVVAAPVPPRSSARHSEGQVFGPQRGPASLHTRRPSACRRIPKTLAPTPNHRSRAQHGLSVPRQLTADMQLHGRDRLASPCTGGMARCWRGHGLHLPASVSSGIQRAGGRHVHHEESSADTASCSQASMLTKREP